MYRLASYNPSACCGAHCYFGKPDSPCWGDVEVVGEQIVEDDSWWIHACQGHYEVADGGAYIPSTLDTDKT